MIKKSVYFLILIIVLVNLSYAKIDISPINEIYNFGDKLYITTDLALDSVSGRFEINLLCGNETKNIERFNAEKSFAAGEPAKYSTWFSIHPDYMGDLKGSCTIVVSIGTEQRATKLFFITDRINIKTNLSKQYYDPEEAISLSIDAIKANGQPFTGTLEVTGASQFIKSVENGYVSNIFTMPKTTESGSYTLYLNFYDKDANGKILNKENSTITFNINQVPAFIQTAISSLEVKPETNLSWNSEIYDQSGKKMEGIISVSIINPNNKEKQMVMNSGESLEEFFPANSTPGLYKLRLSFQKIVDEKEFTVLASPKVEFEFLDSIIIIKSVGNALYNQTIEVQIGNETRKLELNMLPGEERRFNLNAPKGEYNVVVRDNNTMKEKNILLTGNAISIKDIEELGLINKYPIVWMFLIAIVVAIAAIFFFKTRKKARFAFGDINSFWKSPDADSSPKIQKYGERMVDFTKKGVNEAESGFVSRGEKIKSSVVSIRMHNYFRLKKEMRKNIYDIISLAKEKKGTLEWKEDYATIIFSPAITKTFNNEMLAVKTASDILQKVENMNRKLNERAEIGIGVNSGELITAFENKRLKYTSVGNTILLARKIADIAKGKLLVSESIRQKILRDLKVEKAGEIGKIQTYQVLKIVDKEANQQKLNDLMKRMEK